MLFPLPNILPGFLGWVNYFYLFILLCYVAWTKVCTVKTTVFPVVMYRCENWTTKKTEHWRSDAFHCGVLEDFWESLGLKGDQTNQPTENQSWIFIGRTYDETEAPILWPTDVKNWLFGKDPDAQKDWRQVEKRIAEDEMVVWHHWLDGHEFEQALGVDDEQGSLACCSPWGCKESDMTKWLNGTEGPTFPISQLV